MTSCEHTRGRVRGRALGEDHTSHRKRIKFTPEALSTPEVKRLVASFLLDPEDLLDAQVFHPDAWHGVEPSTRSIVMLLERAPLAACTRLFAEFDHTYPDIVAHWKGRRGFDIALDTPKHLLIQYFRGACAGGHVHILQDLKAQKRLTAEDARVGDNYALRWAAANGHVAVLEELRNNWGLTAEDARALGNCALRWAALNGHVAVLVELRNNWGLTAQDARAQNNCALEWAAESGHVAVFVELRDHWAITIEEVRALNLSKKQLRPVRLVWPDV